MPLTSFLAVLFPMALAATQAAPVDRPHILSNMQLVMGALPDPPTKPPLDLQILEETSTPGYVRKKITYQSEAGDRVPAYLLVPTARRPGQRLPAVLCLHQTTSIGKKEPAGLGGKINLRYAHELAERGYITLAPDYPSFGDYRYDFAASKHASGSIKAIWNNIRAVDLLQSLPEVDGHNIGCIGHSLGGHNSLFTAAFEPRIRAVASSCGFTSFPKYYGGKLKGWSSPRYMPRIETKYELKPERMPFDFTDVLSAIAPRAVFVVAPLHDDNFEVSGVRDVAAAIEPVFRQAGARIMPIFRYPDCQHDFPPAAREEVYAWFDKILKPAPKQSKTAAARRWQITVSETAGLRRFGYPVKARLVLPADCPSTSGFRLLDDKKPVVATFRRFPSGEANRERLEVDFAVQLAPSESRTFALEAGEFSSGPSPKSGLKVERNGDDIVVRHGEQLKFVVPGNLEGFLKEVRGGQLTYLAPGSPGLWWKTENGERHPLGGPGAHPPKIVSGLFSSLLQFSGPISVKGAKSGRWEVNLNFVASKSWVECDVRVVDVPDRGKLGLDLNLLLHKPPVLVDLGAGSVVYAALKPGQEIRMTANTANFIPSLSWWEVDWKNAGVWEPFARPGKAVPSQRAEGWAHVMDDRACTALAIANLDQPDRPTTIAIDSEAKLHLTRSVGGAEKSLHFWLHFVDMPVHMGAVTSPQSMLAPLEVSVKEKSSS
jgi:fermentation-respiration switch protein FrsA (DUF1100 family)